MCIVGLLEQLVPDPQHYYSTNNTGNECTEPAWVDECQTEHTEQPSADETADNTEYKVDKAALTLLFSQLAGNETCQDTHNDTYD